MANYISNTATSFVPANFSTQLSSFGSSLSNATSALDNLGIAAYSTVTPIFIDGFLTDGGTFSMSGSGFNTRVWTIKSLTLDSLSAQFTFDGNLTINFNNGSSGGSISHVGIGSGGNTLDVYGNFSATGGSDTITKVHYHFSSGETLDLQGSFSDSSGPVTGKVSSFSYDDGHGHSVSLTGISVDYATANSATSFDGFAALAMAGNDSMTGTANSDVMKGFGGNDTLNGGGGADTLMGGSGSDTYIVDNVGDVVDETNAVPNNGPVSFKGSIGELSANGRFVVVNMDDPNTIVGDPRTYIEDLQTGTLTMASASATGVKANGNSGTATGSMSVSADGRYVAFSSYATNLGVASSGVYNVYVKDMQTGSIVNASTSANGTAAFGFSFIPSGNINPIISGDGHYVVFESDASSLVPGDTNGTTDLFRKDLQTGAITMVDTDASGHNAPSLMGFNYNAAVTSDGRFVAFRSYPDNLVAQDTNGHADVFVKDMQTGTVQLVSSSSAGVQGNSDSGGMPLSYHTNISISTDGRYVLFESTASNLVANDTNGSTDLFIKDLQTGNLQRVSTNASGAQADLGGNNGSMSDDGRFVVFSSDAHNLVSGGTLGTNVYVKDIQTGAVQLIGSTALASTLQISADGHYIAYYAPTSTGGSNVRIVNPLSPVIVADDGAVDTVNSSVSFTLGAHLENLVLTGSNAINGTGNALNNAITGNAGSNILNGGGGVDKLIGGGGNDTYIVDLITVGSGASAVAALQDVVTETGTTTNGIDTLQLRGSATNTVTTTLTLATDLENLDASATGATLLNLTGNASNNVLTGNAADNILNGGAGADSMLGGLGNDTYIVDNAGDVVTENPGEGTDLIKVNIATVNGSYTLGANVENGTLINTVAFNLTGNGLDNVLTGNAAANILNGGIGADTLIGGDGNDTYTVDNAGDVVTETNALAAGGIDLVQSSVDYTLGANLENLTLTGTAINGTGNGLDNVITGNASINTLSGGAGNDTLDGGAGGDIMTGGAGNDTYIFDNAGDWAIETANGGIDTIISSVDTGLGTVDGEDGAHVENLTLTGSSNLYGVGNELDNIIKGNTGANYIDGGLGADTMAGGDGDDTYIVDNAGDVVTETNALAAGGVDLVQSSVSFTMGANIENLTLTGSANINGIGNSLNNIITGNTGDNILNGTGGADTMIGGGGNDTYTVDNIGDVVTEDPGAGTDTVNINIATANGTYTLGANIENGTLINTVAFKLTGNTLDNVLTSNAAADTLIGGDGGDTYVINNTADVITELANQGTDIANVNVATAGGTYTLGANVENGTLINTVAFNLTGNALDNVLTGNAAANILNGGLGADTLIGGDGKDTYVVDNVNDVVVETNALVSGGIDTIQSSISYNLGFNANVENLTLTGTSNITGIGNMLNNVITGNSGNNSIDGGAGADTLIGGDGNDLYEVENSGDVVIETNAAAAGGIDTVQSSVSYTLGANVENLTLEGGAGNINATGNALNNIIHGNDGNNIIDGGAGADQMNGGAGDDTYIVDNVGDLVSENPNEGTDLVKVNIATANGNYTLGTNIENATLINSVAYTLNGNALDNVLTGNAAANILNGGVGLDTLIGGDGNDTYTVDNVGDVVTETNALAAGGIDTVLSSIDYTLGANLEKLTLTGSAINATGNELNNVITGNALSNFIDGGLGADAMSGGDGSDTYTVDNVGDTVTETNALAAGGNDTVQSSVGFVLGANIENLTLTGSANVNGTGNGLANTINGNSGNNVLDGGAGVDTLIGGLGNDIYVVDNLGDVVTENMNEGTDTIKVNIATANGSYTLGSDVENATLINSVAYTLNGNALANVLTGNAAVNTINGSDGNDTLDGAAGADILIGGMDDDTYIVDLITTGTGAAVVASIQDTITEAASAGNDTLQLRGSAVLTTASTLVLAANLENLNASATGTTLLNLTGNALDNVLTGNAAANMLNGGAGADTLIGGDGNDTYTVDNAGDVVTETNALAAGGIDTVLSSIDYTLGANLENLTLTGSAINATGNALNNVILGNSSDNTLDGGAGNDMLNGGAGADTMTGGDGNDTYTVDNAGDTVTENMNEGTDLVRVSIAAADGIYALQIGSNVENATLVNTVAYSLTGNELDNVLTGNAMVNTLDGGDGNDTLNGGGGNDTLLGGLGNDTLDGGAGTDHMTGGDGNDTYVVDSLLDVITENANEGTDLVNVNIATVNGIYTLGANVENGTLINNVAYNLYGNSDDNILIGNAMANVINGFGGADDMRGGDGNDIYVVDNAGDTVTETNALAAGGVDTVQSSVDFTLGANIENLTLTGTAINGTGNTLNNTITGNNSNNTLDGGAGNDTLSGGIGNDTLMGGLGNDSLTGGAGADVFVFNTAPASNNVDTVTDFAHGTDILQLSHALFTAEGIGTLNASDYVSAATTATAVAHDATDHFIYNTSSGALYYDADGNGAAAKVQVATLGAGAIHPALTAADIHIA